MSDEVDWVNDLPCGHASGAVGQCPWYLLAHDERVLCRCCDDCVAECGINVLSEL